MVRTLLALTSPAGPRARLSVLVFHRVLPAADPLFPGEMDALRFDAVCGWLRAWFNVLPLDEAVRRLASRSLPARALSITFDDGYADNHDVALPILLRHRLPATFFIAAGYLDGGRMWNDTVIEALRKTHRESIELPATSRDAATRVLLVTIEQRRAALDTAIGRIKYLPVVEREEAVRQIARAAAAPLPDDLMLTRDQLRAIHHAGMQVGAHTISHPILARLGLEQAQREIVLGKQQLESLLDARVALFAYPNGKPGHDYGAEHAAIARSAGFDAAFSTAWGAARASSDRFELPRFTPWDRSRWRFGTRMLRNLAVAPVTAADRQFAASR